MGLFDKLKAAKDAITGGSAKIHVEVAKPCAPGQATQVVVRAAANQHIKFDSVYLLIRGTETEEEEVGSDDDDDLEATRSTSVTYDVRVEIAGQGQLEAGQERSFEGQFTLPESVKPSSEEDMAKHTWRIQAGLDMFGNDPDSGWQEFEVQGSGASAGASYATRLEELFMALRSDERIVVSAGVVKSPVSEQEIQEVEAHIGFSLDPEFLGFFRSCNGAELSWASHDDKICGGFNIPTLREIYFEDVGYTFGQDSVDAGEYEIDLFGGLDEYALRVALRKIDKCPLAEQDGYPDVALVNIPALPNPVVIFPNDCCAALGDAHPMTAVSYFELMIATGGGLKSRGEYFNRGFGADHQIIAWTREDWASLRGPTCFLDWIFSRKIPDDYAPAMSPLADALRAGTPVTEFSPRSWMEKKYGIEYQQGS